MRTEVPCNGCTACCWHDRVMLGPTDNPLAYRWHVEDGYAVLDRKPDGSCVYLGPTGCSIHDKAPAICRRMDCRELYQATSEDVRARREKENPVMVLVYQAGKDRLHSLKG